MTDPLPPCPNCGAPGAPDHDFPNSWVRCSQDHTCNMPAAPLEIWTRLSQAVALLGAVEQIESRAAYVRAMKVERGWEAQAHTQNASASSLAAALVELAKETPNV